VNGFTSLARRAGLFVFPEKRCQKVGAAVPRDAKEQDEEHEESPDAFVDLIEGTAQAHKIVGDHECEDERHAFDDRRGQVPAFSLLPVTSMHGLRRGAGSMPVPTSS
jgi:hypothetical protein